MKTTLFAILVSFTAPIASANIGLGGSNASILCKCYGTSAECSVIDRVLLKNFSGISFTAHISNGELSKHADAPYSMPAGNRGAGNLIRFLPTDVNLPALEIESPYIDLHASLLQGKDGQAQLVFPRGLRAIPFACKQLN